MTALTEGDRLFAELAFREAKRSYEAGGLPIGSVLARGATFLASVITSAFRRAIRSPMARWIA